ncbi:long-chain-fatty-acid-CoA ligase [Thraustotheca clavata]|uniref:Long-chain-fatty-acid-CoA ligase n=1 Tax=Thraustotheca clavata TaxID=74557 RepID=A0A1W0AAP5_9STRA|nr:long-chain-fatty-acid-CoA ligase [Thraustotheca clavata]
MATAPIALEFNNEDLPLTTWTRDGEVKVRIGSPGTIEGNAPQTVIDVLKKVINRHGTESAMHWKKDGQWTSMTWNEYHAKCKEFAQGLLHLGMNRFDAVSIIGFNSPEWNIANVGAILAGGIAAGIYTTNNPPACQYIAHHARAQVVVCDGLQQLDKMASIADQLPDLKALVIYNATVPPNLKCRVPCYNFSDFLALGTPETSAILEERMQSQRPGHCCTLIYTSGTTGNPKAVMLSHDNITWTIASTLKQFENGGVTINSNSRMVSYLPLSHVAAQLLDIHLPIASGVQIYFAQPDALKGSLGATLKEVRPTIFFGVPRVWEKIAEKMWEVGKQTKGFKKVVSTWAKKKGLQKSTSAQFGSSGGIPCGFGLANSLVLSKVRAALGLDACQLCAVGAAPTPIEILKYFGSLDIPIYELFGQSECCGPQSICIPGAWKMGTVGQPIPGVEWKVIPETQELVFQGRHTMMGYLGMEAETKATIDAEGWLHSGDCASIDTDGFGAITGRIKELIITAGGENIPPVLIEDAIKEELPLLSNVMVIGDKRKFLSALFTLRTIMDSDGAPTNELDPTALEILSQIKSPAKTTQEALACIKVVEYLNAGVNRANARATSRAQSIAKYHLLEQDFSLPGGELTPTLKLKRKVVIDKYAEIIEQLYSGAEGN